jgi:hypothetical protein
MENIPDDILKQIESIPGCDGIIFTGSRQQGTATKNSDWDFYILLADGFESFKKTWAYMDTFIEVFANTLDRINMNDLDINKFPNPAIGMITTGIILTDKSGQLKKIQSRAKRIYRDGPSALKDSQRLFIAYFLRTFIDDLISLEELNIDGYYLQERATIYSLESFYKLNRKWMPKPKDVEKDLFAIDHEWARAYEKVNIERGKERIDAIILLIELLAKKHGLILNGLDIQIRDSVAL